MVLALLKKMLMEGEFDIQQKGIKPILDKKSLIDQIDVWEKLVDQYMLQGLIYDDTQGYIYTAQRVIRLAEDAGYDTGLSDVDYEGPYVSPNCPELLEHDLDAVDFLNTHFPYDGYEWGYIEGCFGHWAIEQTYTLHIVAHTGDKIHERAPIEEALKTRVYGLVSSVEFMGKVISDRIHTINLVVMTASLEKTCDGISEVLQVYGYTEVSIGIKNEG